MMNKSYRVPEQARARFCLQPGLLGGVLGISWGGGCSSAWWRGSWKDFQGNPNEAEGGAGNGMDLHRTADGKEGGGVGLRVTADIPPPLRGSGSPTLAHWSHWSACLCLGGETETLGIWKALKWHLWLT